MFTVEDVLFISEYVTKADAESAYHIVIGILEYSSPEESEEIVTRYLKAFRDIYIDSPGFTNYINTLEVYERLFKVALGDNPNEYSIYNASHFINNTFHNEYMCKTLLDLPYHYMPICIEPYKQYMGDAIPGSLQSEICKNKNNTMQEEYDKLLESFDSPLVEPELVIADFLRKYRGEFINVRELLEHVVDDIEIIEHLFKIALGDVPDKFSIHNAAQFAAYDSDLIRTTLSMQ